MNEFFKGGKSKKGDYLRRGGINNPMQTINFCDCCLKPLKMVIFLKLKDHTCKLEKHFYMIEVTKLINIIVKYTKIICMV